MMEGFVFDPGESKWRKVQGWMEVSQRKYIFLFMYKMFIDQIMYRMAKNLSIGDKIEWIIAKC